MSDNICIAVLGSVIAVCTAVYGIVKVVVLRRSFWDSEFTQKGEIGRVITTD